MSIAAMGKRSSIRPAYTASLATLIAERIPVRAICEACKCYRDVDLEQLSSVKGAAYDLWGRRTRCRITEGCTGWNRFYFFGRGRFESMRDP